MQDRTLISVIIPVYNSSDTVSLAIDSVLQQNVSLELLVIDDGSKDNIDTVMDLYREDDRVRFIKNAYNMGVSATRNRGVQEAKGEFVAFLDADDYWMPNKLEKQLAVMKQHDCVLCSTARRLMSLEGELSDRIIPVKDVITYKDIQKQNWINNSSVLVKRDVLVEFPMKEDSVHEDYLLWLKILKKYKFAYGINEPLLVYRNTTTGKSGNKMKSAMMTYRTYRKAGFGLLHSVRNFVCYAVAGFRKYYAKESVEK